MFAARTKHLLFATFVSFLAAAPLFASHDVFISEYIEGTSNNKAIEIYNPTGSAINLATGNYVLQQYFNGSASSGLNISLTGTVAAGDVYVVAQASASATILAQADQTNSSGFFNGDDAIVLRKGGTSGPIVDVIGQVGLDPGTEWGTGLTSTADNTLRRKSTICEGDTNSGDAFDPSIEWDGFAVDTFAGLGAHTASCGGGIALTISDVSLAEGTGGGPTAFMFTVTATPAPAPATTVTFNIATSDGTAFDGVGGDPDTDYTANSVTGASITGPANTYTFTVNVLHDATTEPNETFTVTISGASGATISDATGTGTIQNDDITISLIHDIQGNGTASPLAGQTVTARGIVTLLKSNGFFLQEELADYDSDGDTSEGIFVFTSSAPTVAVGDNATVTGTAVEFNGLTEISPVTNVTINSSGNTLPAAITLTAADLPTTANFAQPQLEKYEGMRLFAASLTTVAPNDGFFDVYTVLTAQPRPFREPGIPASDPIPPDPTSGLPDANIPIWDENPERVLVDTNGRAGSTGETLTSNVTLTNVAGPLDFAFGQYRLINDANLTRTADMSAVPVPAPAANQFTVAGYNIENFNNNATQRQKAALTIRDVLQLPDIIGTVEIFDLADLQALATEIQTIAPGVTYSAHLIEQDGTSEDSDQDVGYLVKTSRVSVTSVTAERAADTFINPNTGLPETLHDRPPLVLRATVDPSGPSPQPVIVIVNHLRSFIDIELVAGEGVRVRAKRKAQAESLADLLNDLQTDNPGTPVISVGDYNAFQFSSGYDDSISVIKGMPTPDDQIVVDASPDLVNPNYSNLMDEVPAAQRYSFIFEGTPQVLDHMLINTAADALNTGIAVARVNADFPAVSASVYESNPARPERNSDHDPVVGFFQLLIADVSLTKSLNTSGPYYAGQSVTYTITVANAAGGVTATNINVTDAPANLTINTVSSTNCSSFPCTIPSLAAGSSEIITVTATIVAAGAFDNSATATATQGDSNTANNTDNTGNGGTAAASANVSVVKTLTTSGPYTVGQSVTYTIDVSNAGPSTATNINVTDTPANLTITGVSGACTSFSPCTIASLASGGTTTINVTATINTVGAFDNAATATATEFDPNTGNNTDNTGNGGTAGASANVSVVKTLTTSGPYTVGQSVTYTIDVSNAGPSTATNINVTDTPANLTITGVSGACTSFSPCTIASLASGATTTINVTATINTVGAFDNAATATATEFDPNTGNNTDNTGNGGTAGPSANVSVVKTLTTSGPYNVLQSVNYTIDVSNAGPSTATNINVTDTPANLTITGVSGACTSFSPCTIASLASGATTTINVTATINSVGAFDNAATATATEFDPNTGNNTDNTGNGGTASGLDVSVQKNLTTAGPYYIGQPINYSIQVENNGPDAATNIVVTDTPTNLNIVSVNGSGCTSFPCTIPGPLASGASTFVFVDATIVATGAFDNSATATPAQADSNPANNTDNTGNGGTAVAAADVSMTKTLNTSGPYFVGQTVSYTLTVANAGASTATNINVTDTPTNLTITNVSGACTSFSPCTIASLGAGSNAVINVTATITSAGVFDNSATATATELDPNTGNNTDNSGNGGTTGNAADLSVVKSIVTAGPYHQGDTVQFQTVVSNAGPNAATNVVVTDTPIGVTLVAGSISGGGCTSFPCTIPTLANGGSVTITYSGTIQNPGSFDNSATVSATEFDPNTSNNSDLFGNGGVAQNTVDVAITKTLNTAGPYFVGQSVTYTLVVSNAGPGVALFVVVTDTPTNLTITSVSGAGCTAFPCTLVPGVTPTPASNRTITVVATINAAGAFDNSATATPRSSDFDPNLSNNTDNTGNGGTATVNPDADGDGVLNTVEQAAPNGGDGNGDGIQDYLQSTVASLPAATGTGYLTLQSSCQLLEVSVTTESAMTADDPGHQYPHGLIAFRAPCSSATFSLFVYGSGAVSVYRKFGPLPPGGPQQWYGIPATFGTATVGSLNPRRIDFSLTDGGTGDDTPVDGVIVDQGGPGEPVPNGAPTLSQWALIALGMALAAIAALRLRT